MKRHGYLYEPIISFDNLLRAAHNAERGKRFKRSTLKFNHNLEAELIVLQTELTHQTYQPGPYRTFEIYEPKPRYIAAAPFRDRVVHHALCQILMPLLDRGFIPDTYANRTGKGTHRALKRFTHFACRHRYILQCDIRRYFPSIDHTILKARLRQHIKCPRTLWLIDTLIDSGSDLPSSQSDEIHYFPGDGLLRPLRPKGLPIGNLTSQFFANLYLSQFDHLVYETLKPAGYLRYVDDFALFGNDRSALLESRSAIETYLTQLRLQIHPIKSQLFETQHGANFLGFRIFPVRGSRPPKPYIRLRNSYLQRSRHHFKQIKQAYKIGHVSPPKIHQTIHSWSVHIAQGNTWKIRQKLLATLPHECLNLTLERAN
jgi:retron-type reverse transcriptase